MPRLSSSFSARPVLTLLGLAACAGLAASAAPKGGATAPIKDFRLPTFTDEGFRKFIIRAAEARLPSPQQIDGKEVEVTLFSGKADERIDSMLAAPSATLFPEKQLASGVESVRLERIDITVTGSDWSYDHAAQKIVINRDAHVIIRAPLGDILK